jgi:hypothetical protein
MLLGVRYEFHKGLPVWRPRISVPLSFCDLISATKPSSDFYEISCRRYLQRVVEQEWFSRKSVGSKPYFSYGYNWFSIRTFLPVCPIWLAFGIFGRGDVNIILLSVCELLACRSMEDHTLRMDANEVTCNACNLKSDTCLRVKNTL